jgi:hypothetical protein
LRDRQLGCRPHGQLRGADEALDPAARGRREGDQEVVGSERRDVGAELVVPGGIEAQDRIEVAAVERVGFAGEGRARIDLALRVDRADDLEADAAVAARHVADPELAPVLAVEVEVGRVVAELDRLPGAVDDRERLARLEQAVHARDHEQSAEAGKLVDARRPVAGDADLLRDDRIRNRLAAHGGAPVLARTRAHRRVAIEVAARVEGSGGEISDEGRAGEAAALARYPGLGEPLGAVAPGEVVRRDGAGVGPDAVVAGLEAHEAGEDVEGAPAVRCDVVLDLEAQDVPPLRETELVLELHVVAEGPDLGLRVAVDLEAAVEVLERARLRRAREPRGEHHQKEADGLPMPRANPAHHPSSAGPRRTALPIRGQATPEEPIRYGPWPVPPRDLHPPRDRSDRTGFPPRPTNHATRRTIQRRERRTG